MATTNVYGNGTTTATAGANTVVHYYDRAGINMANRVNVYQQFADRNQCHRSMVKHLKSHVLNICMIVHFLILTLLRKVT